MLREIDLSRFSAAFGSRHDAHVQAVLISEEQAVIFDQDKPAAVGETVGDARAPERPLSRSRSIGG